MVFVRSKKIGGKPYAYLVENRWENGTAKQAVKKYLGRIHLPEKKNTASFNLEGKNFREAVEALISAELAAHGFKQQGRLLTKDDCSVNLDDGSIQQKNKPCVLKLNQGYFCSHTFSQLAEFKPEEDEQATGMLLARKLVYAGLAVPQEHFITLFHALGAQK